MNMEPTGPIGIFDSGLGGLSVLAEVRRQLPAENLIYYGDSANAPYGQKSRAEVRQLSLRVCDHLVAQGAKAVVVACNTATSAAIGDLRRRFDIPIIGMEPALKPAVEQTATGAVAVLATALTLREAKFQSLLARFRTGRRIHTIPCPELVTMVESGVIAGAQAESAVRQALSEVADEPLKAVVLGCTHYVFLKTVFRTVLGSETLVIDGNEGTVHQLERLLEQRGQLARGNTTGTVHIENSAGEALVRRSWEILEQFDRMEASRDAKAVEDDPVVL